MNTQPSLWDVKPKKNIKIDDNVKYNVTVNGKKEVLYHHRATDPRKKNPASYYSNMSDSDLIPAIVNLVWESTRKMPAHFTSTEERTQSFCVNFEDIDPKDEYQMASVSYIEVGEYIKPEDNITPKQYMAIVRCGEDIMIGSYITERLKKSNNLDEIVSELTQLNRDRWSEELDIPKVFATQSAIGWFNYCKMYGVRVSAR